MITSAAHDLLLAGDGATRELGRRLGVALAGRPGCLLCLSGHLGAGKTTLVKGLAEGLGVAGADEVTSPTFLRAVRYEGAPPLVHVDAYRMAGPADLAELGLDEDLAGTACVALEWPEIVAGGLPAARLTVALEHVDEGHRRASLRAEGDAATAWLSRADLGGLDSGRVAAGAGDGA